jgi:hypothetical protein
VSHSLCHLLCHPESGEPSALPSGVRRAFSVAIRVSKMSLQRCHPSQSSGLQCCHQSQSDEPSAVAICCAMEVKRAISCSIGCARYVDTFYLVSPPCSLWVPPLSFGHYCDIFRSLRLFKFRLVRSPMGPQLDTPPPESVVDGRSFQDYIAFIDDPKSKIPRHFCATGFSEPKDISARLMVLIFRPISVLPTGYC